jgi:hypothetical protein
MGAVEDSRELVGGEAWVVAVIRAVDVQVLKGSRAHSASEAGRNMQQWERGIMIVWGGQSESSL